MKNALRLALLSGMALIGGAFVFGAARQTPAAQQTAAPPLQRFTVLHAIHVLGPSIEMTGAQANCAITGSSDSATVKCHPIGVTQKSAYTYNVILIAQADGSAYVIACRIGLINNLWCKEMAQGRILSGVIANGHLTILDAGVARTYIVLQGAQIGPLYSDDPVIAAALAPRSGKKGRRAPQAAAQPAAAQPQQSQAAPVPAAATAPPPAAPAQPQQSQAAPAPAMPAPSAAPPYATLGDLPAGCVSSAAAGASDSACVSFASDPSGADIYVDGKFVGNTPSLLPLTAGSHDIRIEAAQRKPWTRTLQATQAGRITIHANLEPADK